MYYFQWLKLVLLRLTVEMRPLKTIKNCSLANSFHFWSLYIYLKNSGFATLIPLQNVCWSNFLYFLCSIETYSPTITLPTSSFICLYISLSNLSIHIFIHLYTHSFHLKTFANWTGHTKAKLTLISS